MLVSVVRIGRFEYLEYTSPRKAFSFAIRGGLKVDWALAWYLNGTAILVWMGATYR
jgi:hypothetical protein